MANKVANIFANPHDVLRWQREVSISDAYLCNVELIRLQQELCMLNTIEEKENNVTLQQQCLEVISKYITREFLRELDS
ncbi:MAG: hypothetical protein COA96_14120 [SAR86 cluster bacterium]|uniref:Uncharacterized protein n=1 Tax=SAR86 cluster bacterium TaxID=2030880 RepID=A0A2A5ATT0_9GAMM|nr:MAG: hypothetical protein COA96_14120 [SAR86 cluster bacterium]